MVGTMNRQFYHIILTGLSLLILLSSSVMAQKAMTFTLEEAQAYALKNNYDIREALLGIEAADKQLWQVTSTGFPQLEASAEYQKLIDIPTQLIPGEIFGGDPGSTIPVRFGKPHNATYGLTLTQLIFSGSYLVGLQASKVYLQLSEQNLERTQLDIKDAVSRTYFSILIGEENRKVLQTSLDNLKKTHYEISEMYKEGFVESTDEKQLRISVTELKNGLRSLDQQLIVAYKLLKIQMGIDLKESISLSDDLSITLSALGIQERLQDEFDLYGNVNYRSLVTQERLADLTLKNEWTTFLPTVVGFAFMQRNAQRDKFNIFDWNEKWYPTTAIGINLSWPIFSGGTKIFRVQKARVELKQAQIQKEKTAQGLILEFERVQSQLKTSYDNFKSAESNKQLASEIYNVTLEKFREGIVSSLDLVQSHNQYLKSESDYLQAISDLLNARSSMDKLLNN